MCVMHMVPVMCTPHLHSIAGALLAQQPAPQSTGQICWTYRNMRLDMRSLHTGKLKLHSAKQCYCLKADAVNSCAAELRELYHNASGMLKQH